MTNVSTLTSINPSLQQTLELRISELENEVQKLRIAAERDGLTGCLRREAFVNVIEERRRFGWLPSQASLVIVDIDFFKKINDTHGHLMGDRALQAVAQTLLQGAPEGSLVCRMGGEEFVVLMPMQGNEALKAAETLRRRIEALTVPLDNGRGLKLTASFGLALWNTDRALLEATGRADAALYQAKHAGRNQVVSSEQLRTSFREAA